MLFRLLLSLTAAWSATPLTPSALLDAPRPPGVTLEVWVAAPDGRSAGVLDLRFDPDATRARLELTEGPREGQRVLAVVGRSEGADRYHAWRPELGVGPLPRERLERLFEEVGVSLEDVLQVLSPRRLGGPEAWAVEGTALLAPPDAAGCRDRYHMADGPLPTQVSLCADAPWGPRVVELSEPFTVEGATLPGRLRVQPAQGPAIEVGLEPAGVQTWTRAERFTREGLATP